MPKDCAHRYISIRSKQLLSTPEMKSAEQSMAEVLITTPRGQMRCYLAEPADPKPHPGVVVLHDVGGMSEDHRHQADWLAEAGFLALAVDLFYMGGVLRCIRA